MIFSYCNLFWWSLLMYNGQLNAQNLAWMTMLQSLAEILKSIYLCWPYACGNEPLHRHARAMAIGFFFFLFISFAGVLCRLLFGICYLKPSEFPEEKGTPCIVKVEQSSSSWIWVTVLCSTHICQININFCIEPISWYLK